VSSYQNQRSCKSTIHQRLLKRTATTSRFTSPLYCRPGGCHSRYHWHESSLMLALRIRCKPRMPWILHLNTLLVRQGVLEFRSRCEEKFMPFNRVMDIIRLCLNATEMGFRGRFDGSFLCVSLQPPRLQPSTRS